jgi:tRNA A37 methylthiotransferase MiaB
MKKVYIESNGCSVVRHDTQRYSKYFRVNGWKEVKSAKEADLVLLTTCAVVQNTEDSAIEAVKRLKKEIGKDSKLIVGGCLSRINPKRLSAEFNGFFFSKDEESELDKIIDAKIKIADIFWDGDIVREHSLGDPELAYTKEHLDQLKLVENLSKKFKDDSFLEIYNYLTKGRFMWREDDLFEVKVADGCNYRCSYCATKNAKGNLKSRDPKKIVSEFKFGVEKGYPKIMLTGDEVGEYGIDIGTSLVKLLEKLVPVSGDSKIALRYISPESLIRQYGDLEKYFKSGKIYYYCASFQSGSPKILKLMNRPNNISQLIKITSQMSRDYKNVYKQTQVIVGFPQETEKDFMQTLKAIKDADFEYVSVIKYSKRPETKAAKMRGHISEAVINSRYKRACDLVASLRKEKLKTLIYEKLLDCLG